MKARLIRRIYIASSSDTIIPNGHIKATLSRCALAHKCVIIQVKELGIYMKNCPTVAKIVEGYFENL